MTFGDVPSLCFDACGGAEAPHEDDQEQHHGRMRDAGRWIMVRSASDAVAKAVD